MPDITIALVAELIATQFPQWQALPIKPVKESGWDNRTFHLGDRMSVRLPSASEYAAQVEKEHRWLPFLRSRLPQPIPDPLGLGTPGAGFPWSWSIYRWLAGASARASRIGDFTRFALDLADFLGALRRIDAREGPVAGAHNFHRGGALAIYDAQTRDAMARLASEIDVSAVNGIWNAALATSWQGPGVWVHGDIAAGNLLVSEGRLCAVIDFGCLGVGDPSCDLVIAWTFLDSVGRKAFRDALALDSATWDRARGWAIWKALITLAKYRNCNWAGADRQHKMIRDIIDDQLAS